MVDSHAAHSGSRHHRLKSRDNVRAKTNPAQRVPLSCPAGPLTVPSVATRNEDGGPQNHVNFSHTLLGNPERPVPLGQSSSSWSPRTPLARPVGVAQKYSVPLDLSIPGSRVRVVSEKVTTVVCTTSREVSCTSLSPQPRDLHPAASDADCGSVVLDAHQLQRVTRSTSAAALRTGALANLRRAHVRRVRLERAEAMSRGRAQAASALTLPGTPLAVEDTLCHPVVPDPRVPRPRLGIQAPPARRRHVTALDAH